MWIIDPFALKIQDNNLSLHLKESLISPSSDETLRSKFHLYLSKSQFWLSIESEYPFLGEQTMKILIQLSTTYLVSQKYTQLLELLAKFEERYSCKKMQGSRNSDNVEQRGWNERRMSTDDDEQRNWRNLEVLHRPSNNRINMEVITRLVVKEISCWKAGMD
ncbi:DUF4371 domain-containing protein [Trichonephila clavipes]|nr:DUF4371 domain-containing protein [Trichonephila clavipes]